MPKGDWIPIFHDLPDSPPVLAICEATGAPLDVIVGRLTLVWLMVDRSTTDGKLAGVGPNALATRIGGDAAFWQAVAVVGWITFTDGGVEIPHKYFGATCRARLLDALRKRTKRTETGQRPDRDRTETGHDPDALSPPPRHDTAAHTAAHPPPDRLDNHSKSKSKDETRRDDLLVSYSKNCATIDVAQARALCQRFFTPKRNPVFRGQLKPEDRELLLKLAYLLLLGEISEAVIVDALEAIRRIKKPAMKPAAYLTRCLYTSVGETQMKRLLAQVELPPELERPPPK